MTERRLNKSHFGILTTFHLSTLDVLDHKRVKRVEFEWYNSPLTAMLFR